MNANDCPFALDKEVISEAEEEQNETPVKRRTIILKKPKNLKA